MRKLVPYLLPLAAFFAAAVLAAPGAAQRSPSATSADAVDDVLCLADASTYGVPYCCNPAGCPPDPNTGWLNEPLGGAGDVFDDYSNQWVSCAVTNGSFVAFNVIDSHLSTPDEGVDTPGTPADSGVPKASAADYPPLPGDLGGCLGKIGTHHGLTTYKTYGPHTRYPSFGNYTHKYDNELYIGHCGGRSDQDCWQDVWLSNKDGRGVYNYNYCSGLGSHYCPNIRYTYIQVGRSWCHSVALGHQSKIRDECWYVY